MRVGNRLPVRHLRGGSVVFRGSAYSKGALYYIALSICRHERAFIHEHHPSSQCFCFERMAELASKSSSRRYRQCQALQNVPALHARSVMTSNSFFNFFLGFKFKLVSGPLLLNNRIFSDLLLDPDGLAVLVGFSSHGP